MAGQVIGKVMDYGFAGTYARTPDMIIATKPLTGEKDSLTFGEAAFYTDLGVNDGIGTATSTSTLADFAGVVVREIKSGTNYFNQGPGEYLYGDAVPVIQRGSVSVQINAGTPTINGAVYVRIAAATDSKPLGGFEAAADGTNTIQLTNAQWGSLADGNGVAELVLLTRENA